jgi:hypothetical protein
MRAVVNPHALVRLHWIPPTEGGREPPPVQQYAATAVFELGGEAEVVPDWPASGEHYSVLLDFEAGDTAKAEFLAIDQVSDLLFQGAVFLVMEGARAVARAEVVEVFVD